MPKVVAISGVGNVEFPDSMSDQDIAKRAAEAHASAQFEQTRAGFENQPPLSAGRLASEVGKMLLSPATGLLNAARALPDWIGRGMPIEAPMSTPHLPGDSGNPVEEAAGNLAMALTPAAIGAGKAGITSTGRAIAGAVKTPGNLSIAGGLAETVGATGAILHGEPVAGAILSSRGISRIIKGIAERKSALGIQAEEAAAVAKSDATARAVAEQRANPRSPSWQGMEAPQDTRPEAMQPISGNLPSGRQPGGTPQPPPSGSGRTPKWQDLQPVLAQPEEMQAISGELPSGRRVGGIGQMRPMEASVKTDIQLLNDISRGMGGRDFARLDPASQATVRSLADRIKASVPLTAEEAALAQHVMNGVEPQPQPAPAADVAPSAAQIPASASPMQLAPFSPQTVLDYMQQRARPALGDVESKPMPESKPATETVMAKDVAQRATQGSKRLPYLFHGTTSSALDQIRAEGLLTGQVGKGMLKNRVYLSTLPEIAMDEAHNTVYGDEATDTLGKGGEPALVVIDRNHPSVRNLTRDRDMTYKWSDVAALDTPNDIPPEAIKAIHIGDEAKYAALDYDTRRVAWKMRRGENASVASAPKVVTIPSPEPEFPAETYAASARATKAGKLATLLHEHGIPYEDAKLMGEPEWAQAAQAAGVKVPSGDSVKLALFELKKLGKQGKLSEMNPKAAKIAVDLDKEMNK